MRMSYFRFIHDFIKNIVNAGDDEDDFGGENEAESRRKWLKMMMTAADGWSDPAVC